VKCRPAESLIETSWLEGHEKGIEKWIEKRNLEIAKEMIRDGESNDRIEKYTGLTDDEIDKYRGEFKVENQVLDFNVMAISAIVQV
jgi:hypothetical protein